MQVSTNTLKKKNEIRRWYHFNDKNRRHTKYRSQKQKACMKENLSERYASLCNTNNFYQMESSELAFPPKICISDWRHAGHHLICVILYYVNLTNLNFPGEGGGGHNPQLKPPLDLRMYTVRREGGKGAVTYTSSLVGKRWSKENNKMTFDPLSDLYRYTCNVNYESYAI